MLLECVPNVSLGPQDEALDTVLDDVREATTPACRLLDVHTDRDHRRTVLTLAGAPVPLLDVVAKLHTSLEEHTTLAGHEGVHPRVGMLDVVPFVALDAPAIEAHKAARTMMHRLASAEIPVYAYADLVDGMASRSLSDVRRRFEGTRPGDKVPMKPDAGPERLHDRLGAACVGVRAPLVAYNVLLDTRSLDTGRSIARSVRASDGGMPGVQALAFSLRSRDGRVQVSTNITDIHHVGLADVFERVRGQAHDRDVSVVGAELVGLAPRKGLAKESSRMGFESMPMSLEDALSDVGFVLEEGR